MAEPDPDAHGLEALAASVSQPDNTLQCCCGNTDCMLLKHNCSVLDSVEKDVHTAARLGQALLARHEALMASAENDRFEMQTRIDQLETDKLSLEAQNARTIQENRALLDQLEALNNSVTDSETHIKDLEASLASSQHVIRKLESQETRAAELESQLGVLETEQAELQSTLVMTQAEARSAMSRWHKAERGISDLQEKLELIEREAREERERHADMINRMEKQRNMEKDLNTAAGRLKGAAAARTIGDGKNGAVVSHFVRDLLADNASLQLGIAELREMLINSNDEIQLLREQLIFHQPAEVDGLNPATTLGAELAPEEQHTKRPLSPRSPQQPESASTVSQELHIHHHYHVTKPNEPRKPPKKKRQNLTPNNLAPPRSFSPNGSPSPWRLEHSVGDSVSTIPSTRWSVFSDQPSEFAPSSVPSSPVSHRRVSVFDRDYDAPTSPTTSVDPTSPKWTRQHRSQKSGFPLYLGDLPEDAAHDDYAESPRYLRTRGQAETRRSMSRASQCTSGLNENLSTERSSTDVSPDNRRRKSLTPSFDDSYESFARGDGTGRPRLRRVASQESVVSLTGGLEIHTLKMRPSQLALKPLGVATAATQLSTTIAHPTIARGSMDGKRGSIVLRDNLLSLPNLKSVAAGGAPGEPQQQQRQTSKGLGRFVSRLWAPKERNTSAEHTDTNSGTSTPSASEEGTLTNTSDDVSPAPSSTVSPGSSIMEPATSGLNIDPGSTPTSKSSKPQLQKVPELVFSPPRTFGINQPGAIPGFAEYWAAHQQRGPPTQIVPVVVDTEALREAVEEGQRAA